MFRFATPWALYGLLSLPLAAMFFAWALAKRRKTLERFADQPLAARLAEGSSRGRRWIKACLLLAALASLVVAFSRPQFGTRLQTVSREGQDVVVALDLSSSMLAEDVPPNRLEKAKHAIGSLIDLLRGDRIALVGFAGRAFVQCPLTLDYGAAKMFLQAMDTGLIPVQGTAIGEAVRKSAALFKTGDKQHKVIILFTDGEDHGGDAAEAARGAAESGIVLYVVGVGTDRGAPIPLRDEQGRPLGFKKDDQGQVVVTRLSEPTLRELAVDASGGFFRLSSGEGEIRQIYGEISGMDKKTLATQEFTQFNEQYQPFVAAALLLLVVELFVAERRTVKRKTA